MSRRLHRWRRRHPRRWQAARVGVIALVVLGGLGSPIGALIAGVVYGLAEQLATVFLPQAMAPVVGFLILVGTILVRPTGIMGYRAKR